MIQSTATNTSGYLFPSSNFLDAYLLLSFGLISLLRSHPLNEPMKQQIVLLLSVLLLSSFLASARHLVLPKQGCFLGICFSPPFPCQLSSMRSEPLGISGKEVKANDIALDRSSEDSKDDLELIDSEECDEKDEECYSRRMIAEAHLDYIYTQHHKP